MDNINELKAKIQVCFPLAEVSAQMKYGDFGIVARYELKFKCAETARNYHPGLIKAKKLLHPNGMFATYSGKTLIIYHQIK